jgi:hypothetical protein
MQSCFMISVSSFCLNIYFSFARLEFIFHDVVILIVIDKIFLEDDVHPPPRGVLWVTLRGVQESTLKNFLQYKYYQVRKIITMKNQQQQQQQKERQSQL